MQLQFNDASQNINAPSATVLDINATDEIELNATLADVNANLDVSGTYTGGGLMTTGGNIVIPDAGNIGSASDTDAIAIGSDGDVTLTQDLELQHDGAILSFGANDEITLTHVHDTGLLLEDSGGTPTLQFHDSNEAVSSDGSNLKLTSGGTTFTIPSSDGSNAQALGTNGSGVLSFVNVSSAADDIGTGDAAVTLATSAGNITIDAQGNDTDIILKGTADSSDTTFLTIDGSDAGTASFNHDVKLANDAAVLGFGADNDVTITHVHDTGIKLNSTLHLEKSDTTTYDAADSDGQVSVGPTIYLENPANANDTVGGQIVFGMRSTEAQARIGATGGTNPSLVFGTADAQRMEINSAGEVGIGAASKTSATLFVYNNETSHQAIDIHQDNSSSTSQVLSLIHI